MSKPTRQSVPFPLQRNYTEIFGGALEQLEPRILFSALTPAQIEQAYGINAITFSTNGQTVSGTGAGKTIAIVDAYADPNIASDLAVFDQTYGISNYDSKGNFALSVATPEGQTTTDAGWSQEIALDVEWAHAIAPGAHILLVEAKSSSQADLLSAVDYAARQNGVSTVSISWGSREYASEAALDSHFVTPAGHRGVTFVVASGDNGVTSWPSTSPNVVAVGGTTLTVDSSGNYQSETAWSGSGGGYSYFENTYAPDVSYNADPNTGYSVYDSVAYQGKSGWLTIGGTSAGAPQWAALIVIADQGRGYNGLTSLTSAKTLSALYSAPSSDYHDITTGSNYFYSAGTGYDAVTGLGTPVANLLITYLSHYSSSPATTAAATSAAAVALGAAVSHATAQSSASSFFRASEDSTALETSSKSASDIIVAATTRPYDGVFGVVLIE